MARIFYGYKGHESFGDGTSGYFGGLGQEEGTQPLTELLKTLSLVAIPFVLMFKPELFGFQYLLAPKRRRRRS